MRRLFTAFNQRVSGFSLMELSVVLLIMGLVAGAGLTVTTTTLEADRDKVTAKRLDDIELALDRYRKANNRLPCPADGAVDISNASFGKEVGSPGSCAGALADATPTNVVAGVVPSKTLQLSDDMMFDGYGRRITYAIDKRMTGTDSFLQYQMGNLTVGDLTVKDGSGNARTPALPNGAIYVLVSHGRNGHGAYQRNSAAGRLSSGSINADELKNCHCSNAAVTSPLDNTFVMKDYAADPANVNNTFDDVVRYKMTWNLRFNSEGTQGEDSSAVELLTAHTQGSSRYITNYSLDSAMDAFTKLTDPTPMSSGNGQGVTISQDNVYAAFTSDAAPKLDIYKVSSSNLSRVADASPLPTATPNDAAFSPDTNYLALALDTSPYLWIYKRSSDSFNRLTGADGPQGGIPLGRAQGVAWSGNSNYLVVVSETSPYIHFYKRAVDVFTLQPTPTAGNYPAGAAAGVAFTRDSAYVAVAHAVAPYITMYRRAGDTLTKLTGGNGIQGAALTSAAQAVAFSVDGMYMAVGVANAPYLVIYKHGTGDSFNRLTTSAPDTAPTGSVGNVAFSQDGTYLGIGQVGTPYMAVYKRNNDTFNKLSDPSGGLPGGDVKGIAFRNDPSLVTPPPLVPTITNVTPPATGGYVTGQTLTFSFDFSEAVTVTGTPRVAITIGSTTRYATYVSGSGSATLVFTYTIVAGDADTDGIAMVSPIDLNGGTIKSTADGTTNANLNFTVPDTSGILVNAQPNITSVIPPANATYNAGQNLDFTVVYDQSVTVTGTPQLQLTIGSTTRYANYVAAGSTATNLIFRYTVVTADQDADGVATVSPLGLNGGTIKNAGMVDANLTFTGATTPGVVVLNVPYITGVSAPANGTYLTGQNMDFTVTYNEAVTVTGSPLLQMTIGTTTVYAIYQSGSGSTNLIFRYTIVPADSDSDGITLVSPLGLNGGTIKNSSNVNADLTFTAPNTSGVKVQAAPVITNVSKPADGNYTTGNVLSFTVTYDQAVTVDTSGGVPRIAITVGSSTVYATYISGSGTVNLLFQYTVGAMDSDMDGIALISPLDLNSGTIKNGTINAGTVFTVPNTSGIKINAALPIINSVTPPSNGAYNTGQVLTFTVNMNKSVTVDTSGGSPRLGLVIGSTPVNATYNAGSSTSTALVFNYTVAASDVDCDGIALTSPLNLNGSTIKDAATNDADPNFSQPAMSVTTGAGTIGMVMGGLAADPYFKAYCVTTSGTMGFSPVADPATKPTATVIAADISPNNQKLAVLYSNKMNLYNISGATLTFDKTLTTHASGCTSASGYQGVAFSPDGKYIATGCSNGNMEYRIFKKNASNSYDALSTIFTNANNYSASPTWSPDGLYLFFGGRTAMHLFKVTSATDTFNSISTASFSAMANRLQRPTFSPVAPYYLALQSQWGAGGAMHNIYKKDTSGDTFTAITLPANYKDHGDGTHAWNLDGDKVVTVGSATSPATKKVLLYSVNNTTASVLQSWNPASQPYDVKFNADNSYFVTCTESAGNALMTPYKLSAGTYSPETDITLTGYNCQSMVFLKGASGVQPPYITGFTPPADGTYKNQENLDFTVTFNESVTITGTPRIKLTVGSTTVYADYVAGPAGTTHTFRYKVDADDQDSDGITIFAPLEQNGGSTIKNAGNVDANLSFTAPSTPNVKVNNTTTISVPANGTYVEDDVLSFTVNFTAPVTVTGTPYVPVVVGSATVMATYVSNNGTGGLLFQYTVQGSDLDTNGIALTPAGVNLSGGSIKDASNMTPILTYTPPSTAGVKIDNTPTITSVTKPADGVYHKGQVLTFIVNYSRNVTVTGTPVLPVQLDSGTVNAGYASTTGGSHLTFTYTVGATDSDINGIAIQSSLTHVAGSTIVGDNGLTGGITLTPPATPNVKVDGIAPTINARTKPADGVYAANQAMNFTFTFTEAVDVDTNGGTPRLALTTAQGTVYADYVSGTGTTTLTFRRTVAPTDQDCDGITIAATLDANGGTITDAADNDAVLTFTALSGTNLQLGRCYIDLIHSSFDGYVVDTATDTFTKKTRPTTVPDYEAAGLSYSRDNKYFATVDAKTTKLMVYKINGWFMSNLTFDDACSNSGTTAAARAAFSGMDNYLAYSCDSNNRTVYVANYNSTTDVFGAQTSLANVVGGRVNSLAFSPDGKYIAAGGESSNYLGIIKVTAATNTFTIVGGEPGGTLPTSDIVDLAFSHDGKYLAAANPSGGKAFIYQHGTGDNWDYVTTVACTNAQAVSWSHDDAFLAVGGSCGTARVAVFKNTSGTFSSTGITFDAPPAADTEGISFSEDSKYLALCTKDSTAIKVYKKSGLAFTSMTVPALTSVGNSDRCDIKFANDPAPAPFIQSITASSNTYWLGDTIDFTVTYNKAVTVDTTGGTPTLTLTVGATPRSASYVSGSGTTTLIFRHTVQAGDLDTNGLDVVSPVQLNSGTMRDSVLGYDADPNFTNVNLPGVKINGVTRPPTPLIIDVSKPSNGTYKSGDVLSFTVTYDQNVNVVSSASGPRIKITLASGTVYAKYSSGSGAALTFNYTVQTADLDTNGITLNSPIQLMAGNSIMDATNSVDADLNFAVPVTSGINIDSRPQVIGADIAAGWYKKNSVITVTLDFNQTVYMRPSGGTICVPIQFGGLTRNACQTSIQTGTSVTFTYTVVTGDGIFEDWDGIDILSPIAISGSAYIVDNATKAINANTAFSDVTVNDAFVDTKPPSIVSVTGPDNGTYSLDDTLDIQVQMSEIVNVAAGSNRIRVTLDSGNKYAGFQASSSGTDLLLYQYTVVTGDLDTNGIVVDNSIDQTSLIADRAGNLMPNTTTYTPPTTTGVKVKADIPKIVSVTIPNGTYTNGQVMTFTVKYDRTMVVNTGGGTPKLDFDLGGAAKSASFTGVSGANLTFTYTVGATDIDCNGITLKKPLRTNGGTIQDISNVDGSLNFTVPSTPSVLVGTFSVIGATSVPNPQPFCLNTNSDTFMPMAVPTGGTSPHHTAVAFSHDNKYIASSADGHATLYVKSGNTYVYLTELGAGSQRGGVAFNFDSSYFAVAVDNTILIYSHPSGNTFNLVKTLTVSGVRSGVGFEQIDFSKDGKYLAATAWDDDGIFVWKITQASNTFTRVTDPDLGAGSSGRGFDVAFSPDSKYMAYSKGWGSGGDMIQVYSISSGGDWAAITAPDSVWYHPDSAGESSIAWSHDSSYLAIAHGSLWIYKKMTATTFSQVFTQNFVGETVQGAAFTNDSKYLGLATRGSTTGGLMVFKHGAGDSFTEVCATACDIFQGDNGDSDIMFIK